MALNSGPYSALPLKCTIFFLLQFALYLIAGVGDHVESIGRLQWNCQWILETFAGNNRMAAWRDLGLSYKYRREYISKEINTFISRPYSKSFDASPPKLLHHSPDVFSEKTSPTDIQEPRLHFPNLSWYQLSLVMPPQQSPCRAAPCHPQFPVPFLVFNSSHHLSARILTQFHWFPPPMGTPLTVSFQGSSSKSTLLQPSQQSSQTAAQH